MKRGLIIGFAVALLALAGCGSSNGTGGFTDTTTTSQLSTAAPTATEAPPTDSSGGPCNGNPCIGDWQKEAAEGGTVVQCQDGTYSHAGGLSGACSDHGGESSGADSSGTSTDTTPTETTTDASGPCNGNPCIGDWQKEAAKGGAVVQCQDGTYSHAGGLSGACSHHGGEASSDSGSTDTSTGTTSTASGITCTGPGGGFPCYDANGNPISDGPTSTTSTSTTNLPPSVNQCWANASGTDWLAAGPATTLCKFANNTFYEYWKASGGDATQDESGLQVWGPIDHQYYTMDCTGGDPVMCSNGDETLQVVFSAQSVLDYTSAQAQTYTQSGKLGPNG